MQNKKKLRLCFVFVIALILSILMAVLFCYITECTDLYPPVILTIFIVITFLVGIACILLAVIQQQTPYKVLEMDEYNI